jgi:hypothetical protein
MKKSVSACMFVFLFSLLPSGCRSAFVSATITNKSPEAIKLLEVDYPSASFGVGSIAPGAQFHYRFKIQGSGQVKLQFNDASGKTHTATGPDLQEGEQGTLQIDIDNADHISWIPNLKKIR